MKEKKMKWVRRSLLLLSLLWFLLPVPSFGAEENITDDIFKEFYATSIGSDEANSSYRVYRLHLIDEKYHIYTAYSVKQQPGYNPNIGYAGGDPYDFYGASMAYSRCTYGFSGVFQSDTARITSMKICRYQGGEMVLDETMAYCLPEGEESLYTWNEEEVTIKEAAPGENIFSVCSIPPENVCTKLQGTAYYQVTVEDQGVETVCTFLPAYDSMDYLSFDAIGRWDKNKGEADWSEYVDVFTLYDGTDGKTEELAEEYQYGRKINWQEGNYQYGIAEDYTLLPYAQMQIPSDVKSIRLSYEDLLPEPTSSVFLEMPGDVYKPTSTNGQIQLLHNYLFYRNKTRAVSINGGEWCDVKAGEVSEELPLQKGINFLYIAEVDKQRKEEDFKYGTYETGLLTYVILLYWDGEEGYEVTKGQDASLKDVEIYQGAFDEEESADAYEKLDIGEETDAVSGEVNRSIHLNSSCPYVWINAIANDPGASISVENSTKYLGGFFKRLDASKDYFEIEVTSADGTETKSYRIHIEWTLSSAELASLNVLLGGTLEQEYDPEVFSYYCEKGNIGRIIISYGTTENTTTEVYVDRVKKETLTEKTTKTLTVSTDVHEILWKITTNTGKKVSINVYFDRGEETGISDETKARAKAMIDKMTAGGYLSYLTEQKGGDYWKTFGAAALGEEYLHNMLGFDVTTKEFRQGTDWAAVILELVMSGENPYDYLGVNYVEGLMSFNNNGNFGDYSANIWALSALQAAGAEIPEETIAIVKGQALRETFDLDMRGWAFYAISSYIDTFTQKEYARMIQSVKGVQIHDTTDMNGIDVTGCFENSFYTNRNIMSHACMVTGLTALGIDLGSGEFDGENGADPISVLENYQSQTGGWFYSPEAINNGSFNKDVVIAVGDLYNGSNVYTRYYLTEDRYKALVDEAKTLLNGNIENETKRDALQTACDAAAVYVSEGSALNTHGMEYYALQEAMYAVDESVKPGVFLGTAEEREQVNAVKEAIASISSYCYSDKENLDAVKAQYDALGTERLFHYITNADVLDDAYGYVEAIDNFLEAVDKLDEINLTKTAKVQKARALYEALSEKQREEVVVQEAYSLLLLAEETIEAAKTADQISQAITYLGEVITLDSAEDVESVRAAYDSLTEEEKAFVTNLDKLEAAEQQIAALQKQQENRAFAQAVVEKIAAIGTVNQNSEGKIQEAREAYDALEEEEAKRMVDNYSELLDAESSYQNLILRRTLDNVLDMAVYKINQISEAYGEDTFVTPSNVEAVTRAVEEARSYIEAQVENQPYLKSLAENYPSLCAAEAALSAYEWEQTDMASVEDFLASVGAIEEQSPLTVDGETAVQKAEYLYQLLSSEDQAAVQEAYEVLQQSREELSIVESSYADIRETIYAVISMGEVHMAEADRYLEAQALYDALSEELKARIPEEILEILQNAADTYTALLGEQEKVQSVISAIESAAGVSSLSGEDTVLKAREDYDTLENKERVTNYTSLLDAEQRIAALKKTAEDQAFAADIITKIHGLTSVTKTDADKVEEVRRAYNALTDGQKALVTNLAVLEKAEAIIAGTEEGPTADTPISTTPSSSSSGTTAVSAETPGTAQTGTGSSASSKKIVMNKKNTKATAYLVGKKTKYTLSLVVDGKTISPNKVKWKSSKSAVAKVSKKGVLTVKKKGKMTITATYKGKKYTCKITVKKAVFKLKKAKASIKKGESVTIKTKALPENKIVYKSMNKKIAAVTGKGKVVGKKKGKTKIKVVCNGITRYFTVTVK